MSIHFKFVCEDCEVLAEELGTVDTGIGEASISLATQWFRPCETGISFGMATF